MRLTFWILDDATDVVPSAVGGDGGQSDLIGQRDSQVWYGVGYQHTLLWLLPLEVYLLRQQVLLVLDLYRWTHIHAHTYTGGGDADMLRCILTNMHTCAKNSTYKDMQYTRKIVIKYNKSAWEANTVRDTRGGVNTVTNTFHLSPFPHLHFFLTHPLDLSYHPHPQLYPFTLNCFDLRIFTDQK